MARHPCWIRSQGGRRAALGLRCFGVALLVASAGLAAPANAQEQALDRRAEVWRGIVDAVVTDLPRLHVDPFHATTPTALTAAGAAIRDSISVLSDQELFARLVQLVATIGDGHTDVNVLQVARTRLPLYLARFGESLYVTHAHPATGLRGARLLAIGRTDASEAFAVMSPLVSRDNRFKLDQMVPVYLTVPELLVGVGLAEPDRPITFIVETPGGDTLSVELAPVTVARWREIYLAERQVPHYLSRPLQNYWHEWIPESKAVYLRVNRARENADTPLAEVARDVFARLDEAPGSRLVIDLRANPGGDSRVLQPVIEGILARPELTRDGRLFVLIDTGTDSSALLNAIDLAQAARATLVGEPTGARPNHYGEVRTLRLPQSGIQVSYPTRRFVRVPGDPESLVPDVWVELDAAGFFAGRDPVLSAALADSAGRAAGGKPGR